MTFVEYIVKQFTKRTIVDVSSEQQNIIFLLDRNMAYFSLSWTETNTINWEN